MTIKEQIANEKRWHPKSQLILIYHTMCQLKHGCKRPVGWTLDRTAAELNLSKGYISEALQLAKGFLSRPENLSREQALKQLHKK